MSTEPSGTAETPRQSVSESEPQLPDEEYLAGQLARLEAENERLRDEYSRVRQTQYRRTALALVGVGLLAAVGSLLLPGARTVLLALAGTGVFLGVLTYYLVPERFLPATIGRDIYATLARNEAAVVDELGLSDTRIYLPADAHAATRLYVPQTTATDLPDRAALTDVFLVEDRGVAFRPTGAPLFEEFEQALTGDLGSTPAQLTAQLCDALVEQFELVEATDRSVPAETTRADGTVNVGVSDSVYGPLDQFDHPVVSFLAVGLSRGLETPIVAEVQDGNGRVDAVVQLRWPADSISRA